jgi:hypothetical protein
MMRWAGHAAYMWYMFNIFLNKRLRNERIGRRMRRDKDNRENNLTEIK